MKNYNQYDKMNKEEKTKEQTAFPKINVDYSKELGSTISENAKASQTSNNNSGYTNKNAEADRIFNLADGKNQNILANPENLLKRNKVESAVNKVYEPMLAKSQTRKLDMPKNDALKTKTFLNTLGYTGVEGNTLKEDDIWDDDAKIALEKYVGSGVPKQEVFDLQKTLNENGIPDKDGKPLKEDGKYGIKTDSAVYNARNMFRDISDKDTKPVKGDLTATTPSGKSYTAEYPLYNPENKPRMLTDEELWKKYSDKYTPQQLGFVDEPFQPNQVEYAYASRKAFNKDAETYIGESGITKWRKLPSVSERIPKEYELYKKGEITKEMYNAMDRLSQRWFYADTEGAREEIERLAKNVRDRKYQIKDFTEAANKQLFENGQSIISKMPKLGLVDSVADFANYCLIWYNLVKPTAKWDYKVSGANWMTDKDCFFYHGELINASDFGNINYGYTGTILGLTSKTLYDAGGHASTNPSQYETDNYYGDSEVDHYWIQKGIEQANSLGYYGTMPLPVDLIFSIL